MSAWLPPEVTHPPTLNNHWDRSEISVITAVINNKSPFPLPRSPSSDLIGNEGLKSKNTPYFGSFYAACLKLRVTDYQKFAFCLTDCWNSSQLPRNSGSKFWQMGLNKSSLAGRLEWGGCHLKRFTYLSSAYFYINATENISLGREAKKNIPF